MEVIAAPIKMKSGTGGPCRVFARILNYEPAAGRVVGVAYVVLPMVVFLAIICVVFYFLTRRKTKIKV